MELKIGSNLTAKRREILSNCMGMHWPEQASPMGGLTGWKIYDRSMHMKIAKSLTAFVKDSIGTNDHGYTQAAPRISDMTPIKEIYIYSNLQSNTWTDEGTKVGYIAVFNVNQS